ncbi:MAG: alpha/beta hydrolase [Ahniella sp.]|nr:alpha/beta hydrolase [Ahniella sp.]
MSITRYVLLVVLSVLATQAVGGQLADLPYGNDGSERKTLDLYLPAEPGPWPLLVHVPGRNWRQADKRAIGNRALTFNALGNGVVAIDYRQQPDVDWREQLADLSEAITWIRTSARQYGGDPDRLILHGEGSGAHLIALLLSRAEEFGLDASDLAAIKGVMFSNGQGFDLQPQRLGANNSVPAAMRDPVDWLERSPFQLWRDGRWPVLMLHDAENAEESRRFAARLKERGAAVTESPQEDAGGDPADATRELSAAWLKSLGLGRIQRFETMNYSPSFRAGAADRSEAIWFADRAGHLVGHQGVLYAALDAAATTVSPTSRVIRLDGPGRLWRQEFRFPLGVSRVDWLGNIRIGGNDLLLAVVATEASGSGLWLRRESGTWVPVPVPWSMAQSRVHSVLSDAGQVLVLGQGRAGGIWRIQADSVDGIKVSDEPEVRINGTVGGLIASAGQIYGVWQYAGLPGRIFRRQQVGDVTEWLALTESDPQGGGQATSVGLVRDADGVDNMLIVHAGAGRITRWQPGSLGAPQLEFEIDAALRGLWGDGGGTLWTAASGFQSGLHPETNERVSILGIGRMRAAANEAPFDGAHLLIRQTGGHYSIGSVHDFDSAAWPKTSAESYVPSPFVADQGRSWYVAGAGTAESGNQAWIEQGQLDLASPKRGPWWDRGRSGHGFDLQRIGNQWALLFYSFDADGAPTWWSALGQIERGQFTSNANGLMLTEQVLREGQWTSAIDADRSGTINIRFGLAANEGACNDGIARTNALALAELTINLPSRAPIRWCIEPMQVRTAGNGGVDNNGIWTADLLDTGWGLSLIAQGLGADNTQGAIVYYYDAAGQPRWALGSGTQRNGRATLSMLNVRNTCPDCAQAQQQYRAIGQVDVLSTGACGDVATRASIDLRYPDLDGSVFVRQNVTLQRLNESACY